MMFWRVPNKMEQTKELIGFCLFMRMETILSNFMRNYRVLHRAWYADCNVMLPWRQRTVDTWTRKNNKYFLMITPVLTKPGHCVWSRRAKCPCFHPHTLQSRLKVFFLSFFFPGDEAETGRTEVFNGYMVCQHLSFQSSWIFPSS